MASDNSTNNSNSSTNDPSKDDDNPFISFRRLIDDRISSAIKSLNEQAGIMTQPDQHQQRFPQTPDEGLSALFNIFSQPPLHGLSLARIPGTDEPTRAPSQLWGCLLRHASSGPRELDFGLCETYSYPWWRHYSSYAPANLIHDEDAPEHMQPFWHRAFLDLMATHNGERMSSSPKPAWDMAGLEEAATDVHATEDRRNMEWQDDRPQWWPESRFRPFEIARGAAPAAQAVQASSQATEEDMYNSFLDRQSEHPRHIQDAPTNQEQTIASRVVGMVQDASRGRHGTEDADESPIISMVTTSHTTTMPDGSRRTVKRFKRTFADGREESSEDIQDRPSWNSESVSKVEPPKEKKGWFWN